MSSTNERAMSVRMETVLVIKIAGHTHRLTLEKARDLNAMLSKYLSGNAQSEEARKVKSIQEHVVKHFGLHPDTFASTARDDGYSWPRHIAMFLSREMVPAITTTELANCFCRERSTIQYALKSVANRMAESAKHKNEVEAMRREISDPRLK